MVSGWNDDEEYYSARARKERALASEASEFGIARIHEQMAERYESLAAVAKLREAAPVGQGATSAAADRVAAL